MYKWIVFDCMETLIDMEPLPRGGDYALWAYEGSVLERAGVSFQSFHDGFEDAKRAHVEIYGETVEWRMDDRIMYAARYALGRSVDQDLEHDMDMDTCWKGLFELFWQRYLAACYMSPSNLRVIETLKNQGYGIAVASNFTIKGGVEEILGKSGALHLLDQVHASIDVGFRKPDGRFYRTLLERLGVTPEEILFIGDDYACDYVGPRTLGITSCLYDRTSSSNPITSAIPETARIPLAVELRVERLEDILTYLSSGNIESI